MQSRSIITRFLNPRSCFLSSTNPHIVVGKYGNVATLKLNKPKALNALDQDMLISISEQVKTWEQEKVAAVIFSGEGKALCAGGDIKTLYNAKINPDPSSKEILTSFFYHEYRTDYAMATMKPTLVALLDGIVMGGGVGISVNAKVRICTESTLWAMPEAKIGLFTDVGAGYFLTRIQNKPLGLYLALTGYRLKGADVLHAGLADYYYEKSKLNDLVEEIKTNIKEQNQETNIHQIASRYASQQLPPFSIKEEDLRSINKVFTFEDSFKDVYDRLEQQKDKNPEFYQSTKEIFSQSCPMSLRIIFEQFKKGAQLNYQQNLMMDFRLVQSVLLGEDFTEGVKSVLIDKQHKPKWLLDDPLKLNQSDVLKNFDVQAQELFDKKELVQ